MLLYYYFCFCYLVTDEKLGLDILITHFLVLHLVTSRVSTRPLVCLTPEFLPLSILCCLPEAHPKHILQISFWGVGDVGTPAGAQWLLFAQYLGLTPGGTLRIKHCQN